MVRLGAELVMLPRGGMPQMGGAAVVSRAEVSRLLRRRRTVLVVEDEAVCCITHSWLMVWNRCSGVALGASCRLRSLGGSGARKGRVTWSCRLAVLR